MKHPPYRKSLMLRSAAMLFALSLLSACGTPTSLGSTANTSASLTTSAASTAPQSASATASSTAQSTASAQSTGATQGTAAVPAVDTGSAISALNLRANYSAKDLEIAYDEASATRAVFSEGAVSVEGTGAQAQENILRITSAGTYVISGSSADGQILIDAAKDADIILVLEGLTLTSPTGPAIQISEADKVILTLAQGSDNNLSDGAEYSSLTNIDGADAVIWSKADLTINGSGALTVTGQYKHGIVSKDDLKIVSGTLTISAPGDGIRGKDLVAIRDGQISVSAGGDGIQSDNEEDAARGNVLVEGGTLSISAELDGIQAEHALLVSGGDLTITTGGGSQNSSQTKGWGSWGTPDSGTDSSASAKALKAGESLAVTAGIITIDSSDDSIHSNGDITIAGGAMEIASGDDAIHADRALTIQDGDLYITTSFEGLEGASVTIEDGKIHLGAMDDGINTSGGRDGSSLAARPGRNGFDASDGSLLTINGGSVFIDAAGDGIDANGSIAMTGGTVVVNGPTNNGNGAVDYNGDFTLKGGTLLALGSSGMAMNLSATSSQASFLLNTSQITADSIVSVSSASGDRLLSFTSKKAFSSILLSHPSLQTGETYLVTVGGTATGRFSNGLLEEGASVTGDSELTKVEMTSAQTSVGEGGMPGPGGGRPTPGGFDRTPADGTSGATP